LGMTPTLYAQLAGSLTVYSKLPGVNPAYASRSVLLAVPGATPEIVDTYIAQRADALAAKQPLPQFPIPAQGGGPVNVWRIRAEVTTADGVTFVRESVVRATTDRRRPLIMLAWNEGERAGLGAATGGDQTATTNANGS